MTVLPSEIQTLRDAMVVLVRHRDTLECLQDMELAGKLREVQILLEGYQSKESEESEESKPRAKTRPWRFLDNPSI